MKITQSGGYISISGMTKAQTTYHVVVSAAVMDGFGQLLGKDAELTFHVGDPSPTFFGPQGMVVVDPTAKRPTLDFFTTNYEQLKVRLYAVEPSDYDAFGKWMRERWNRNKPPKMPGSKKFDQLVKVSGGKNQLVETSVDMSPALTKGLGHVIAIVEPYPWTQKWDPPQLVAWVQSTKLGVDAYVDNENLLAMATELATGKAAAGIELEIRPFGTKGKTDDKGMATLPLTTRSVKGGHYLVAKRGDDVAFVSDDGGYWNEYGSWTKREPGKSLAWYVIDDRKMYKPGEEVTLKGWLRLVDNGKNGDVMGLGGEVTGITYKVTDSQGREIAKGDTTVNGVGGWSTKFTLPKTPNLGYAYIALQTTGRRQESHSHNFQIEEFRRPEFEVSTQASQGPFLVGQSGEVTVNAKYFAGGPLPGAPVTWDINASQTQYTPPNRDEFVFGEWVPWWGYRSHYDDDSRPSRSRNNHWNLQGTTDGTGAHVLHMDYLSLNPAMPMSVTASASVTDVNRQTWSSSSALIVHPSALYVGLKTKKSFVEKGIPFDIDVIGVDIDGKSAIGTPMEVKAARIDWEYKKGKLTRTEADSQTCNVTAAKDPVPCTFTTKQGGTYEVVATIVDSKGRPNQTKLTFWVSGGEQPPSRELAQDKINLIPDEKEYKAGDTAELMIQAPFYPAEALVTWRRSGIVKSERFTVNGPSAVIKVPITEQMVPNMYVQVDLVGMTARTDDHGDPDPKLPKRPAYAKGEIDLPVPPKQRTLKVTVAPNAPKLAPGESAKISLDIRDAQGRPVPNAEAAVIVVDEAILALTGYQFPNPIDSFYGHRGTDTREHYLRQYVKLAKPDANALAQGGSPGGAGGRSSGVTADKMAVMEAEAPMDAAPTTGAAPPPPPAPPKQKKEGGKDREESGGEAQQNTAIAIRSNFNPLAAFAPAVKTDAQGKAVVDIKMPDNLTRYRIVAIVASGERSFGKGESAVTARLPLMVRPSPPRFLNFGDTFKLPVIVQNQTDAPMTVKVAVRATNAAITDGGGREVTVPANDRVEVQFPAAAEMAGTARFQIVGASGGNSDAAELALPVWTPATTEAFATYGVLDDGATRQPIALPGKVITEYGGLEVSTASTNLQSLTDAFLYIVHYPFDCAEQRASRILSIAALRDVLEAFETKDMPPPAALEKSVADDIEHLAQMQNYDGGYAFWDRGYPSEPYLTVYVTNALQRAKAKGYKVPQQMLDRSKPYLQQIEQKYPWYYGKEVRWAISAYAQGDGRSRHQEGSGPLQGSGHRDAEDDRLDGDDWLAPRSVRAEQGRRDRAQGDHAVREEPRERAGRCRELRDELRRRQLPVALEQPARRRRDARVADPGRAEERSDPEDRHGPARASQGGTLAQHAGKLVHPARARPVLPDVREGDAGLCRARVARQGLRRRSRVQGPLDRYVRDRHPDELRRVARSRG
jgi:alpha-2-macroglobulin